MAAGTQYRRASKELEVGKTKRLFVSMATILARFPSFSACFHDPMQVLAALFGLRYIFDDGCFAKDGWFAEILAAVLIVLINPKLGTDPILQIP